MEDTKLYSTQNIERLKQKIAVYRETLTTLKKGTSIEEFLNKKEEFDGFKIQIAHLEGLTKTIDENQSMQSEGYGEKVKQIANQIDILNQTVEEMNQEISSLIKKELKVEVDNPIDINRNQANVNTPLFVTNEVYKIPEETPQVKEPFLLTNNAPSYMQLQKLAGLARSTKPEALIEKPVASNPTTQKPPEERHFNHQYFQSINTHPSHMYNGLYKNISNTSSFHFKNESSVHEIPIYKNEPTEIQPMDLAGEASTPVVRLVEEVESNNSTAEELIDSTDSIIEASETSMTAAEEIDPSSVQTMDKIESSNTIANEIVGAVAPIGDEVKSFDSITEEDNFSAVPKTNDVETITTIEEFDHFADRVDDEVAFMDAVAEDIAEFSFYLPFEEANIENESSEMNVLQEEPLENLNKAVPEEHKKEGFSSFFNLFRRRV